MTQTLWVAQKKLTIAEFIKLIKKIFANHIGEENAISLLDLMRKFFPDIDTWEFYKQYTYLSITQKAISKIRRTENVFIINKNGKYFVLKTQQEADFYKNILKKDIIGMNKSIIKADEWIKLEKWKKLGDGENEIS